MKQTILISLIYLFGAIGCRSQPINVCEQKAKELNSYTDIISWLKSTSFKINESVSTSSSTWITSASYYSCDGEKGYLILGMKKKEYVFSSLPRKIWNDFKKAEDFGKYYHEFIRGRYRLELN